MSHFREKAEAQTKQIIGQMLGDDLLIQEGQEQLRHADGDDRRHAMPTGMPKTRQPRAGESKHGADQGIVRDERGQEQPKDKNRAQHVSRVDRGNDPPGRKK